jgi:hypothetical protein
MVRLASGRARKLGATCRINDTIISNNGLDTFLANIQLFSCPAESFGS